MSEASIELREEHGQRTLYLSGAWVLASLNEPVAGLRGRLRERAKMATKWDLSAVTHLDSAGATLLWHIWNQSWPAQLSISPELRQPIARIAALKREALAPPPTRSWHDVVVFIGKPVVSITRNFYQITSLIGQLVLDIGYLCRHPQDIPWREFSANLFKSGALALPVIALVGFLIGVVLSFLSALQLKTFGADAFIVNLLGISIIRELGPIIVAVLVAGRSGSAMTAQIGVMRVTEEIDALATMGISRSLRLILPKVLALSMAMPLLVVWCSTMGILGGMFSAKLELGMDYVVFLTTLPRVVPLANLWIGIGKGVFFGFLIALIACHFGLKVKPNTESLSARTTSAVVTAITTVILIDAIFAVLTRGIGMPGL